MLINLKKTIALSVIAISFIITGCARDFATNNYESYTAGEANRTMEGTVLNVRLIKITGGNGTGGMAGVIAGAAAGSAVGGSSEAAIVGAIGGAVAGGLLGDAAEKRFTSQDAVEVIVKLDNGKLITTTQGNDINLTKGQRVFVIYGDRMRIIPQS